MHDERRRPSADDTFAYVIKNRWIVPAVYALGILAWLGVVYGYVRFFSLNTWYWVIFGPVVAVFTAYHLLTYGINLFYRPFDVAAHARKVREYWRKAAELPTVDVFLPVCGEDMSVLTETFAAVRDMEYPEKKVHVLDDGASEEVGRLAAKMGFDYHVRPNRGHMKKAGNLKYGHERTTGEFIVVFDADFAPHKDFVTELLPYMADPKVAIVQSPQHFRTDDAVHDRSILEFGAGQTQEDFYRIIQVARDRFNGAICVGSNAVYRRSALDEIGGVAQIEHSEDVHTGFDLVARGHRIAYVPLVLATGICPSDLHAYFHQQHRWCSGSMTLWRSRKFREAKLTLGQRLCYWSGFLYYLSHALAIPMAFQIFVVLFRHFDAISWTYAIPFIPHLVFSFLVLPFLRTSRPRVGTSLVRAAHSYSYAHSVVANVFAGALDWHPTNAKGGSVSRAYAGLVAFVAGYLLLYVGFIGYAVATRRFPIGDLGKYAVMFWVWYFLATNLLFLGHAFRAMDSRKRAAQPEGHAAWRARTAGGFLAALLAIAGAGYAFGGTVGVPGVIAITTAPASPASFVEPVAPAAPLADAAPAAIAEAPAPQAYAETAAAGDSVTLLYRRIISRRCIDARASLTDAERTFVETSLAAADGRGMIDVGAEASSDAPRLDALFADAHALADAAKDRWSAYAKLGSFDDACRN
ncbi:MAG TPA: cellulose synthase catalytic subunit [Candidatus Binatia bacterium]|nr:cellulose synthase catalytic subunit [Candidatus Binatia bacterium]